MSGNERPELRAFRELETLVRHLGEELAAFRRRAITAETQLQQRGSPSPGREKGGAPVAARIAELEEHNAALQARLDRAESRVRQMLDRVRFLRQQVQSQAAAAGAGRS